jgi:hypothetical protein
MLRATVKKAGSLLLVFAALGCSWVEPSERAGGVRLASAEEVSGCERLGKTTSSVADSIGPFSRGEERVADELATLARNEAALMGGDAVAPESPVEDGRQVFGVYRCSGT